MNWQEWFEQNGGEYLYVDQNYALKIEELYKMFRARMMDEIMFIPLHIAAAKYEIEMLPVLEEIRCEAWWDLEIVP